VERKHPLKWAPSAVQAFVARCAGRYPEIQTIFLFGSRARGDAKPRSDFDLAVVAPGMPRSHWSRFAVEMQEDIPTLCELDLVLLDDTLATPLRTRIQEESVVIYERAA
jgi:predicted nucleotidyltransferase